MSEINIIVSVEDASLPQIQKVAQAMQKAGVRVQEIMDVVGVITGSCDIQTVSSLAQIEGVKTVEKEQIYNLSPPDSDIQ